MIAKRPKLALLLLGVFLVTFIAVACNNSGKDKKETAPENKSDTTKMDTASTRPVKTTD